MTPISVPIVTLGLDGTIVKLQAVKFNRTVVHDSKKKRMFTLEPFVAMQHD